MNNYFSPFLALRYLKPKRSFVSIITLISVLGVALGVTVLVVVIAVFTGFGNRLKETILASQPHLVVDLQQPNYRYDADGQYLPSELDEWPNAVERINEIPGIISVTPFVNGPVLIRHKGYQKAPMIQAFDPPEGPATDRYVKMTESQSIKGRQESIFDLSGQNVVVGDDLAYALDIEIGETITITSPDLQAISDAFERIEKAETEEEKAAVFDEVSELTLPVELDVVGLFNTGNRDVDANTLLVSLEIGQEMYDLGPHAHGLAIHTEEPLGAATTQKEVRRVLEDYFPVRSWMDNNRQLLDAIATERSMMFFLLFIIMVVAGFCIMNTMFTVVHHKRAEIGLVKALGASEWHIVRLFLLQGVIVGLLGVAAGQALGHLLVVLRNVIIEGLGKLVGRDLFDPQIYMLEGGLPAEVTWSDSLAISFGAFVACVLASLIPAWIAARMQPAEALRSE